MEDLVALRRDVWGEPYLAVLSERMTWHTEDDEGVPGITHEVRS
jgi:hypothetical protein